jgi:hypothetical protein
MTTPAEEWVTPAEGGVAGGGGEEKEMRNDTE